MKSRNSYDASFKTQVVLESMQRDTTIEKVRIKYNVATSVINRWRKQFKDNAHLAFEASLTTTRKKKLTEDKSPEYLKRLIGDLTVENSILKKALSVWD